MKVALVHDWLNTKIGGGELVLLELAAMFPDAPIYTLLFNAENYADKLDPDRVRPSFLQAFPSFLHRRSRYFLPLAPWAIEQFDFSEYDVVISTSSAFARGIKTPPATLHICYCFSPMRFVWDYWPRYLDEQNVGWLTRQAIIVMVSRLRQWDLKTVPRVNKWVAISKVVAARIKKYYHQDSIVIYPPAKLGELQVQSKKSDYYVTLATLTPYKRIDLAIQACNQLKRPLKIMGDGADLARLKALAGPTISFEGRVTDAKKAELLAGAKALLFPNEEDFGIAPIEAMASGTPVIAYNKGGLTETIRDGVTGVFFDEQTPEALAAAIEKANTISFKTDDLTKQAAKFTAETWRTEFKEMVATSYHNHVKTK